MSATLDRLLLRDFAPRPALRATDAGAPATPRFPIVDAHNHLGGAFGDAAGDWPGRPVAELLTVLDAAGVERIVDLDGRFGDNLAAEIARLQAPHPDRIAVFAGIDYDNFATDPNFGETEARRLRASAAAGARGLKVWKLLGLRLRDAAGRLIPVDHPRLDPLWTEAAALGLPVMIHVADPVAFFQPADRFNERIEELAAHPDWHFFPTRPTPDPAHPDFPTFDEVIDQFARLLDRHRQTTFIGAHVGCYAENLAWVGQALETFSNFYVDPSARMAELGRQPYTARDFFIRWQDRILFGTDAAPNLDAYARWRRFLETRDEYFPYDDEPVGESGRWNVCGLDLPDDVLRKVYRTNALRVIWRESDPELESEPTTEDVR
ncbi:MAG: amidohydrolase family protein [Thermomicrobiales bacterium]|nr:amidohydrolase family protein [Thermomicrobiales bacterium]